MGDSATQFDATGGPDATFGAPPPGVPVSDVIVSEGAESRPAAASEVLRGEAGDVRAKIVSMERAGADRVTGERVTMTNSGARTVEARSAQIERSGVLAMRSERVVLSNSTAVAVAAEEARIVRGATLLLKAGTATIEGDARIAVYAGPADAAMRPIVDARGAVAFGLGVGAALLFLGEVLRRIFRSNERSSS